MTLPTDAEARKRIPLYSGCVAYFPDALAAVAELSQIGNDQHHPGTPLHWDKSKSADELDALMRHAAGCAGDPVARDEDGVLEAAKIAWRALANLQRLADKGVHIFSEPAPVMSMEEARELIRDAWMGVDPADPAGDFTSTLVRHRCKTCGTVTGFEYAAPNNQPG